MTKAPVAVVLSPDCDSATGTTTSRLDPLMFVPEKRELFGEMSVEDNLLLGGFALWRKGQRDQKDRMAEERREGCRQAVAAPDVEALNQIKELVASYVTLTCVVKRQGTATV